MLELRPNCECCDADLPPEAEALICTYECTWCPACARSCLGGYCPNCNGSLSLRPIRPPWALAKHPASTRRVTGEHAHGKALHPINCPGCGGTRLTLARYPRALCDSCVARATSPQGEPLTLTNASASGGFVALHRDTHARHDAVTADHVVHVGALPFHADEARFGGVVVEPLDPMMPTDSPHIYDRETRRRSDR